jgi:outer membrane lipoprotein-sorting protein
MYASTTTQPNPDSQVRGGTTSASSGFATVRMNADHPLRETSKASVVFLLLFFASLHACPVGYAAEKSIFAPENVLSDPATNPAWSELFAELSKPRNRFSRFEERRTFPFRDKPIVLQGEIRIVPNRGISLSYTGPKPHIVIVDQAGVLMRDERGRQRSAPDDSRARAVTSALSHILRFDLTALEKEFILHGLREGEEWTLGFAPRDSNLANLLGTVVVHGQKTVLDRIEMTKSDAQRIEIVITKSEVDVIFPMDVLQRFFR